MMKRTILALAATFLVGGVCNAADITVPHTFTSGTTIKSSEVNENFSVIYQKINELQAEIQSLGVHHMQEDTETLNFDDNLAPDGWTLTTLKGSNFGFSNQRFQAVPTDSRGKIEKAIVISENTSSITIEYDANTAYSAWGMGVNTHVSFPTINYQFGIGHTNSKTDLQAGSRMWAGMHKDDGTGWNLQSFTEAFLDYHLTIVLKNDLIQYKAVEKATPANVLFDETYQEAGFTLSDINKLGFDVHSNTDATTWIDNIQITIRTPMSSP